MNKFEIFKQCGALVGLRFKAAPDSDNPEMEFKIIEKDLHDSDGFKAVKLRYKTGETEIAAVEILRDGVQNRGLIIL